METNIAPVRSFQAEVTLPGDRHIGLLAALLASFANGSSKLTNFPFTGESRELLGILQQFGLQMDDQSDRECITIHGKGLQGWGPPADPIPVGDSEILTKLLAGSLAGQAWESTLVGSDFLSMVPFEEITNPLGKMGAEFQAVEGNRLPLIFQPAGLRGADLKLEIMEPFTKACILLAGLFAKGETRVVEALASVDHPERLMAGFGADIQTGVDKAQMQDEDELDRRMRLARAKQAKKEGKVEADPYRIALKGGKDLTATPMEIPGDVTVGANLLVLACLLPKSRVRLKNMGANPTRSGIVALLKRMGANIETSAKRNLGGEPCAEAVAQSSRLTGRTFSGDEMVNMLDEVPALAVAASFASGRTVIRDVERLRSIDADYMTLLTANLRSMGVKVGELPDGLIIDGADGYDGTRFETLGDGRISLAFAVAGLCCKGESQLRDNRAALEEFPAFWKTVQPAGSPV